jgi:hypothetical protein
MANARATSHAKQDQHSLAQDKDHTAHHHHPTSHNRTIGIAHLIPRPTQETLRLQRAARWCVHSSPRDPRHARARRPCAYGNSLGATESALCASCSAETKGERGAARGGVRCALCRRHADAVQTMYYRGGACVIIPRARRLDQCARTPICGRGVATALPGLGSSASARSLAETRRAGRSRSGRSRIGEERMGCRRDGVGYAQMAAE